jgi:hypothetical protein
LPLSAEVVAQGRFGKKARSLEQGAGLFYFSIDAFPIAPLTRAGLALRRPRQDGASERIPFRWNRNSLRFSFGGRIFCGEPVSTSPENAL